MTKWETVKAEYSRWRTWGVLDFTIYLLVPSLMTAFIVMLFLGLGSAE